MWGRFRGYSATRRTTVGEQGVTGSDQKRSSVPKRTILHDGRLQLGIVTTWPENSNTLRQAVEKTVSTIEVD